MHTTRNGTHKSTDLTDSYTTHSPWTSRVQNPALRLRASVHLPPLRPSASTPLREPRPDFTALGSCQLQVLARGIGHSGGRLSKNISVQKSPKNRKPADAPKTGDGEHVWRPTRSDAGSLRADAHVLRVKDDTHILSKKGAHTEKMEMVTHETLS